MQELWKTTFGASASGALSSLASGLCPSVRIISLMSLLVLLDSGLTLGEGAEVTDGSKTPSWAQRAGQRC